MSSKGRSESDAAVESAVDVTLTLEECDWVRIESLRAKLEEYRRRRSKRGNLPWTSQFVHAHTLLKEWVLRRLLKEGTVAVAEAREEFSDSFESNVLEPSLTMSFGVIGDYVVTGGKHVALGTGLPQPRTDDVATEDAP